MQRKKFAIVNYGVGNHGSLKGVLNKIGHRAIVTYNKKEISDSDFLILPGVGTFPEAIKNLKKSNLFNFLKKIIKQGKPTLGICLGMQILTSSSNELSYTGGLRIITGNIKNNKSAPYHIGWNKLKFINKKSKFCDFQNEYFYFQHGFSYIGPKKNQIASTATKKNEIVAIIQKKNVMGIQFHPEKSQENGLEFLAQYVDIFK